MDEVLKELMGESYSENLSKEEITSFFENRVAKSGKYVPLDKYTDMEKKAKTVTTLQNELDTYKKAQMTEQEKQEAANKELIEQNLALQKRVCKSEVEKVLTAGGLVEEDYKDIIDNLVLDDVDKSAELAKNLVNTLNNKIQLGVKTQLAEKLANAGSKPQGQGGAEITKDMFKQMTYSQQMKLAETNPTLYASVSSD